VLLDGGLPQSSELIAANIQLLGFKLNDVKLLFNSHAHFDHSGGLAALKELTRVKMVSSKLDAHWLQSGYYPGRKSIDYASKPVQVDQLVSDGESVSVGDINLTAHLTAGHTPGCTS
jgi:metallo-beta-lactamase class B